VQETKLTTLDASKCYNLWGNNDISWVHRGIDKDGGGILTLWDNKKFTCSISEEGKGFILTEGMYKSGDSVVGVKVVVLNVIVLLKYFFSINPPIQLFLSASEFLFYFLQSVAYWFQSL